MKKIIMISFICLLSLSGMAQVLEGPKKDLKVIQAAIVQFSEYVMNDDAVSIGQAYTEDAKIFATNREIIEGRENIQKYWTNTGPNKTTYHKIIPEEITVQGKTAYDYGRYEGTTTQANGDKSNWQGKYVIVWKKIDGQWKIYLDIWNRTP